VRQAADEPRSHRVPGRGHDDRNHLGYLYGGACLRRAVRHDHIDATDHEFTRERLQAVVVPLRTSILQREVLSLDPPLVAQSLFERLDLDARRRQRPTEEKADLGGFRLLRLGNEGRGENAVYPGMPEDCYAGGSGDDLFEEPETFGDQFWA
jgi:hypothetical protein